MENIFNTLGECLNPGTAKMRSDLTIVESQIKQIERQQSGGYTAQVAKSFYLGMVGGSGCNMHRLNQRRERELDKTIDLAVKATKLYAERDKLKKAIEYIESGQRDRDQQKKQTRTERLVQMWKDLKSGDILPLGNPNGNPVIQKKSLKSCTTIGGTKWTAAEIIGKDAAKLL